MAKSVPSFPRIHLEQLPEPLAPLAAGESPLTRFCRAFGETTGWPLTYKPRSASPARAIWSRGISGGSPNSSGTLAIEPATERHPSESLPNTPCAEISGAERLADAFGSVLSELEETRHALWQREAELAAGVPVSTRPTDHQHLAVRLEAVLKGGAEAIGCTAAALYLLDEGTSELKLRASFGLPPERLLSPARPLRGSLADLEALVGHAVVLEDVAALPHWKAPENFPSAVCVPVSTATTPLGTLWMFSSLQRDFSPEQANLVEIIAGRLAADLEREVLLQAGSDSQRLARQMSLAAEWQRSRLPYASPQCDGWQLAGYTNCHAELSAGFYDWQMRESGSIWTTAGMIHGQGFAAALNSAALQSSCRAYADFAVCPSELLAKVESWFTSVSPGDERASLFAARLDQDSGLVEFSAAGELFAVVVREQGCLAISGAAPTINTDFGGERQTPVPLSREVLSGDDSLVVVCRASSATSSNLLRESLFDRRRQSAAVLLDTARAALGSQVGPSNNDSAILVIKRRRK